MKENFYSTKTLWTALLSLFVFIVLLKGTAGLSMVCVLPLVIVAMIKRSGTLLMFCFMTLATMVIANKNLVPKPLVFWLSQRGSLSLLALYSIFTLLGHKHAAVVRPVSLLLLYIGYMFLVSASGWSPLVSYLKLLLFTGVFLSYYGVSNKVVLQQLGSDSSIRGVVLAFAIVYIWGSVALYPFPSLGQLSGEEYVEALLLGKPVSSLFMGMTTQSQCLGPIVAALAVFLLGDLLFSIKRFDWLYFGLLICCPLLVYWTSSRTALGTLVLGVAYLMWLFVNARGVPSRWKRVVLHLTFLSIFISGICGLAIPEIRDRTMNFLVKKTEGVHVSDITIENLVSSRQSLVDSAMYNFRRSPLIGNGFQVNEEMAHNNYTSISQLITAPVEKGVWVTAVLEEGGLIGMFLVLCFFIGAQVLLIKRRAYIGASTLFTFLIANFGEFMMFSMSYTGGFMWGMVFVSLVMDATRLKRERMRSAMYHYCGGMS